MNIIIEPKKILGLLLVFILLLQITNIVGLLFYFNDNNIGWLFNLFNIRTEGNIPAYYSSMTILIASFLLGFISLFRNKNGLSYSLWQILAVIFFYLSIDEAVQLHERVGVIVDNNLNLEGYLSWGWVIPYGILFVLFSLVYYFKFLPQLPKKIAWLFILSGAIFVLGAIGVEMIAANNYNSDNFSEIVNAICYSIEEFLEMLGIALFIYSLLLYIKEEIVITLKETT
ncbi:hypothetical protein [Maribacter aestuarii]|uniref:hypothetical protein n=1 Tax=Maribacter aestuarii TaxID=1130723 RepID=UPI0025A5416F|nr:hypothetical protein [Maribacter aestuarii]